MPIDYQVIEKEVLFVLKHLTTDKECGEWLEEQSSHLLTGPTLDKAVTDNHAVESAQSRAHFLSLALQEVVRSCFQHMNPNSQDIRTLEAVILIHIENVPLAREAGKLGVHPRTLERRIAKNAIPRFVHPLLIVLGLEKPSHQSP